MNTLRLEANWIWNLKLSESEFTICKYFLAMEFQLERLLSKLAYQSLWLLVVPRKVMICKRFISLQGLKLQGVTGSVSHHPDHNSQNSLWLLCSCQLGRGSDVWDSWLIFCHFPIMHFMGGHNMKNAGHITIRECVIFPQWPPLCRSLISKWIQTGASGNRFHH